MSWKEEINNTKKVLKEGTASQKLEYIWDYYKLPILLFLVAILFIGSFVHAKVTAKEYILQGMFLNSIAEVDTVDRFEQDYLANCPIDLSKEDVFFDTSIYYSTDNNTDTTSYQSIQLINARIAAGEIDFMVAENSILTGFSYNGYFYDLSEVLSEEQFQKYEPYFLYYDLSVAEKLNETDFTSEEYEQITLPDPAEPELMEQPIPVMIDVSSCPEIDSLYTGTGKGKALVFVANGKHPQKTLEFLDYLME